MHATAVAEKAQFRHLHEREAVMPDRLKDLAQAMFDYDSAASHADAYLRHIVWNRENAVLALGTAARLAQVIFAHP